MRSARDTRRTYYCLTPDNFRTKWKRQTSLGLELLTSDPPGPARGPDPALCPAPGLQLAPAAALELYYRSQLGAGMAPVAPLPLPSAAPSLSLILQSTQYSTYLAQLAARVRNSSSLSCSSPTSSPPSQSQPQTPSPGAADTGEAQSTKTQ